MDIGKSFESVFQHSIMDHKSIFTLRINDSTNGELPADFISVCLGRAALIETKATEKSFLLKSAVKNHQLNSLFNFSNMAKENTGVVCVFLGAISFVGYILIEDFISLNKSKITEKDLIELKRPLDLFNFGGE